jgi:uncharacterized protein
MSNPSFNIFKSPVNNQFYYHLKAANGEIILSGEGYTTKQACQNGVSSVQTNAYNDSRYQKKDSTGNYTFNLLAANGEVIGKSENYTSSAARDNGIASVKKNAPIAIITDKVTA